MKELLEALEKGNLESVKKILASENIDIEGRNVEEKLTLLMLAARWGHLNIVKFLLNEKKANINAVSSACVSALGEAAIEGHLHIVRYLLEEANPKASIYMKNSVHGTTALHCAATCNRSRDVLVYLCSKYPKAIKQLNEKGENLLHIAVANNCTTNIECLVRLYPDMLLQCSKDSYTPFHEAIFEGSLKHVKLLLSLRPELFRSKSEKGYTPLLVACVSGKLDIVKYLLTKANTRSNLDEATPQGQTALHCAATSGNIELIKYLISKNKLNEEQADKNGFTPLHYASAHGQVEVVQYFLSRGSSCSILNDMGEPALSVLINETQGDNFSLRNLVIPIFSSALKLISTAGKKSSAIDDLIAHLGIGINGRIYIPENREEHNPMYQGCTALHVALMKNGSPALSPSINPLLVIKLLEAGASLDIQNKEKVSCFELLISQENPFYHALAYFYKAKNLILKKAEFSKEQDLKEKKSKDLTSNSQAQKTSLSLDVLLAEYPNAQNDQSDVKEAHEHENIEEHDEEHIQEYLTRAAECSERKMNEEDKNLLLFVMGSSLANPISSEFLPKSKDELQSRDTISPYPVEAYNFLSRVEKTNNTHFVKANDLLYQLLASGQVHLEIGSAERKAEAENAYLAKIESLDDDEVEGLDDVENAARSLNVLNQAAESNNHQVVTKLSHPETEAERVLRLEYLIKYAIHANSQYAVLGKNIAAYTQGESHSMMGIKGFVSFREPESCFALVKTMRQDHVKMEQEKHALEKENQALKAKHNAELTEMRMTLQEIHARMNLQSSRNQHVLENQQNDDTVAKENYTQKRNGMRRKSL